MAKARHPCSASRVFARYRPGVNKTVTRPCDVMMREIQLFWRTGTQLVKCSVSDRRCILLLQFKFQIHLKYISQECSQLKCKPCWAWKIFKKSWTLHLGGLHLHVLKGKERGRVPTQHHHHLKKGAPLTANDVYFKTMLIMPLAKAS